MLGKLVYNYRIAFGVRSVSSGCMKTVPCMVKNALTVGNKLQERRI